MSEVNERTFVKMIDTRADFYCLLSNMWDFVADVTTTEDGTPPDGWLAFERVGTKREAGEGEVRAFHFTVADGVVKREYLVISEEEAKKSKWHKPRIFSKLKAVAVLMKAGYWENCKKFIEGAGLYDLYLAANEFSETNEYFVQGKTKIQTELGLTDDAVEALLAQCVKE